MRPALLLLMGFTLFSCAGGVYKKEEAVQVPPAAYQQLIEETQNAYFLDIRTGLEYRKSHLPGFRNVNYLSLSFHKKVDSLDRDRPVFIYCQTAHRSPLVAQELIRKGFTRIIDLEGGYKNYRKWEQGPKEASE